MCQGTYENEKDNATNWECLKITYFVFYNSDKNAWKDTSPRGYNEN